MFKSNFLWHIGKCGRICVGWEYAVEASHGGFGPVERRYHMSRRRRWVRTRHLVKPPDKSTVRVCSAQWCPNAFVYNNTVERANYGGPQQEFAYGPLTANYFNVFREDWLYVNHHVT